MSQFVVKSQKCEFCEKTYSMNNLEFEKHKTSCKLQKEQLDKINFPLLLEVPSIKTLWDSFSSTLNQSTKENPEILSLFKNFLKLVTEKNLDVGNTKSFKPFESGGKDQMEALLLCLNLTKFPQEQLDLFPDLPIDKGQIKKGFSNKYTVVSAKMLAPYPYASQLTKETLKQFLDFDEFHTQALRYIASNTSTHSMKSYCNILEKLSAIIGVNEEKSLASSECLNIAKLLILEESSESMGMVIIDWAIQIKQQLGDDVLACLFDIDFFYNKKSKNSLQLLTSAAFNLCDLKLLKMPIPQFIQAYYAQPCLTTLLNTIIKKKAEFLSKMYPEKPLDQVLHDFSCDNKNLFETLSQEELERIKTQYLQLLKVCSEIQQENPVSIENRIAAITDRGKKKSFSETDKLTVLAIARERIREHFGIYPYNTQILAVLAITLEKEGFKGRIAQIKTGEGKSTIITMLALVKALEGQAVDIITSSRYLAIRDQKKYQEFFETFKIATSHICIDHAPRKHFVGQIIYGTNYDFEFSVLFQKLYNLKNRCHYAKIEDESLFRPCDTCIVDEVDNFFIDKSQESARVAIQKSDSTKWIYPIIYEYVKNAENSTMKDEELTELKEALKSVNKGFQLSDRKLQQLYASARRACYVLKENTNYVIKPIETIREGRKVFQNKIVIVDYNHTGRLHENSRWQKGTHEFLEIKHGLDVEQESLMAASLSHPVYFEKYKNIYGLSGTMGSSDERKEIKLVYKVDSFDVPTHLPPKLQRLQPIYCGDNEEFMKTIFEEAQAMRKNKRPCLILCQTIKQTEELSNYFAQKQTTAQLLNAVQKEKEEFLISRAGHPSCITIATNAAGRGTDITLHLDSKDAGGLHVIFTFYPANDRVEFQGVGRAGRQGNPGTARIIISRQDETVELLFRRMGVLGQLMIPENEDIFGLLVAQREADVRKESFGRLQHAQIERIHGEFLDKFFEELSKFYGMIDDGMPSTLGSKLFEISKTKKATAPKDSGLTDLIMRTNIKLEDLGTQESWKAFIQALIMEIRSFVLQEWGQFYENVDDIDHEFKGVSNFDDESYEKHKGDYTELVKTEYERIQKELQSYLGCVMPTLTSLSSEIFEI